MLKIPFAALLAMLALSVAAQGYMAGGSAHLPPLPAFAAHAPALRQSLNGRWEINMHPSERSVSDLLPSKQWQPVTVPGEARMQGFATRTDTAFIYRKKITVFDTPGKNAHIIRFNGVYSHARVYCNGHFVREHFGGFTAWDADITPFIKPGADNWLHVVVTDRADDISYASGYAKHPIGGILRKVDYLLLPDNRADYIYVKTGLAHPYTDGVLSIKAKLPNPGKASVRYELSDPSGKRIHTGRLRSTDAVYTDSVVIPGVKAWTAETPDLYTLTLYIDQNGKKPLTYIQKAGFRTAQVSAANELLVNGRPVKLRGACRHDMHPVLGRSTNRQQDSLDVRLAKEANMNFIRTSHYPPSEDFLEFCDRYGIYVQEETAVCFVREGRTGLYSRYYKTMDDPAYTGRYLSQLSEMIDRDRNHASVIMWSIGNESGYGANFQKEYDFVKAVDPERPVAWSFPFTAFEKGKQNFDILVSHYPEWNRSANNLRKFEYMKGKLPMIADEWAHVSCYNTELSVYDPNVRDFWGKSLDSLWIYSFREKSYIGGAIWGMIDEVFHMKDTMAGYGPWGIIDVWRRKKPEFWNTRKAYSPVRLLLQELRQQDGMLTIPVHNRFDHTNLKDVQATATINGRTTVIRMPDVAPHATGSISIPAGAAVLVQFRDRYHALIDEEQIIPKAVPPRPPAPSEGSWTREIQNNRWVLKSRGLTIRINARTGAIEAASVHGQSLITGNPLVVINKPEKPAVRKNAVGIFSGKYTASHFHFDATDPRVFMITSNGYVDQYPVAMTTALYPGGRIEIRYTADSIPEFTWDIGIGIPISASVNKISWTRRGYWTTYPREHLSALSGSAVKIADHKEQYGIKPSFDIARSMNDYVFTRGTDALQKVPLPATEIYRAKKENIEHYTLYKANSTLSVVGNGAQAAKMNVRSDGSQQLLVSDKWDYWGLSWGNYQGAPNKAKKISGTVTLQLQ